MDDEPVLVAGAGPVGLGTAILLARWGVPTVVLDSRTDRDVVGSRSICTQRDVLDIFVRIGCGEAMRAEGVTWTVGRTYYRGHELSVTTFPDSGDALPPWLNIPQSSTERLLAAIADREPLVDVRLGHEVTAVTEGGDGVRVRARTASGTVTVRGSHLVAADGSRSTVRGLLGIEFPGRSFDEKFLICDIRCDLPFPNERRFHFDPEWNPGRQVLVHQCPDRTWRIDWQVPSDYDEDGERRSGGLDARIRAITGDLPYEIVWQSVYRFHERVAPRFRHGRVFLAGDAAHLYAPFGARGLNSGMQDAENLAWKLALVRRGWARGRAVEALLDSYHRERHPAALENLRVTSATMEFLVPRTPEQRARRLDILRRALADPSARSLVDSGRLAEPFRYAESPLTTPASAVAPAADGAAPGAGTLCPDAPCAAPGRPGVTRLRELFGSSFVVLLAGEHPGAAERAAAAVAAPVVTWTLDDLAAGGGAAVRALRAGPDSVHVVRPDGHLCAVWPRYDGAAVDAALRRACGDPNAVRP